MVSETLPAAQPANTYPALRFVQKAAKDPLAAFLDTRATSGDLVQIKLGPTTLVLVHHPEDVAHVLRHNWRNYGKGGMWVAIRKLVGNGLLGAEGDLWREQRKLIQPAFHKQRLAALTDAMSGTILETLVNWRESAAQGTPIDMTESMFELTMQIIVRTMFGSSLRGEEARTLGTHFTTALKVMQTRMMAFMLPQWIPLPGDKQMRESLAAIDKVLFRLIAERKAIGPSDQAGDMLDMLLAAVDESGAGMSDRQLRDECFTMFLAGHETSATVLSWVWAMLSQHPDVEQRLQAEMESVLGERRPTFQDLPNLVYTRAVIEECMRMYPPGWLVPRSAEAADTIRGTAIPAGATVLISMHAVHRHPAFWENAEIFDPERFMPGQETPREAFMPFGDGPRQCMGLHFAMMEMQLIVAMIVQAYQRQIQPEVVIQPKPLPVLRPQYPLLMTLSPRTRPVTGREWLIESAEPEAVPVPVQPHESA
jgi:cytochrome P450